MKVPKVNSQTCHQWFSLLVQKSRAHMASETYLANPWAIKIPVILTSRFFGFYYFVIPLLNRSQQIRTRIFQKLFEKRIFSDF